MEFYKIKISRYRNFNINSNIGLNGTNSPKTIYYDDILMTDIQTDPIQHRHGTNISNISVLDSKYCIGFEIPIQSSPSSYLPFPIKVFLLIPSSFFETFA